MQVSPDEWQVLHQVRQLYLNPGSSGVADYWDTTLLSAYDKTLAQRIGWKWQAVLTEIGSRLSLPAGARLIDWGCGTGIAGRQVLNQWPSAFNIVHAYDRSAAAQRFAVKRLQAAAADLEVSAGEPADYGPQDLVLISHVINELPAADLANLLARLRQAGAVLWVEPGASRQSRQLAHCRETLRDEFELVGPCAHQKACGMLHADRRNDWCHFFAKPPAEAFHTRFWAEFHKQLGIDARSLPVSFIALVHRNGAYRRQPTPACRRVLARPRILKGRCELLVCDEQGVHAETVLKRHSKALFKGLQKDRFERWLDQNIVP